MADHVETCAGCRTYLAGDAETGECIRRSPRFGAHGSTRAAWPVVSADHPACGEAKPPRSETIPPAGETEAPPV